MPCCRFVRQDTLLFSHNERSFLTYPDQFSRASTRTWNFHEWPPDELKSTKGDKPVEFELWQRIVKDGGKIDCNKNLASTLKEEHFEKRYEVPLHDMKKTLLASLLKAENYKKGNGWTNFIFTRDLPYFRFVGRDTLLFSHNERSFLTYPNQFSRASTRTWNFHEWPPDEPKSTKGDEPLEFELRQKIVKDYGMNLHWTSWINRGRISSHINKKNADWVKTY